MSSRTPTPRNWGSIADAAELLGVHRDTVRRLIDRGDVYAERIGASRIRVDLDSARPIPLGPPPAAKLGALIARTLADSPPLSVEDREALAALLWQPAPRALRRPVEVDQRIAAGGVE